MSNYYIVDQDGNLRFTTPGRKELSGLFATAGMSIDSIKTERDYLLARQSAQPFFMEWLAKRAESFPKTLIHDCLKAAVFGTDEEFQTLFEKLEMRNKLTVIR